MKQEEEIIQINDNDYIEPERDFTAIMPSGSTPFDLQFQIGVETLNKLEEPSIKKNHLLKRITKYFWYNAPIEPGKQHFFPRRQPNYENKDTKALENQLVLYGSDFAKFKQLKRQYKCSRVEKIDDSHCKMIYLNFEQAWNSIRGNIKDEKSIVSKMQSDTQSLPKCWFEMKPYVHLQSQIQTYVRFATTDQRVIDAIKESELQTYKVSKEIYNNQEEKKMMDYTFDMERKREKIEVLKQKKTERLYDDYENRNPEKWIKGKSINPGANRQQQNERKGSRSRSREKMAVEIPGKVVQVDFFDIQSSYSVSKINNRLENMNLQQLDLSFHIEKPAQNKPKDTHSEYNWGGSPQQLNQIGRFSYKNYMKEQEQQESRRKRLVHVICLDQ